MSERVKDIIGLGVISLILCVGGYAYCHHRDREISDHEQSVEGKCLGYLEECPSFEILFPDNLGGCDPGKTCISTASKLILKLQEKEPLKQEVQIDIIYKNTSANVVGPIFANGTGEELHSPYTLKRNEMQIEILGPRIDQTLWVQNTSVDMTLGWRVVGSDQTLDSGQYDVTVLPVKEMKE